MPRPSRSCIPTQVGLYDSKYEVDSCGVGFIADVQGRASRNVVSDANRLLVRMTHRGAKYGEDGDGAGVMVGIPHRLFKKLAQTGQLPFAELPPLGRYGVGQIFLPNGLENEQRRADLMDITENVVKSHGLAVLGWRILPKKSAVLGPNGRATEPYTVQLFVTRPCEMKAEPTTTLPNEDEDEFENYYSSPGPLVDGRYDPESSFSAFDSSLDGPFEESGGGVGDSNQSTTSDGLPRDLERLLYLVRRKLCRLTDLYICSLSCRVVVYKGQLQSEHLFSYFDDLMDEDLMSYFALVHARFSTNTFPTWDRAHPFRRIAHNGEINTIEGNRKWLAAREANAAIPSVWGTRLTKEEFVPFEEEAFQTQFHTPESSTFPLASPHSVSTASLKRVANDGRLVDTLAIPTNIESARRRGSIVSSCDSYPELTSAVDEEDTQRVIPHPIPCHSPVICEGEEREDEDGDEEPKDVPFDFSSDSASLDGVIELLMMAGRELAEAVMLVVPESIQKSDPQWKRDFNRYNSCVMEPWDGPALVAFTDGIQLGAHLDRNGYRPGRYTFLKDGRIILASEVGVVDFHPSLVSHKGRLTPGRMLLIDFREGRVVSDEEIKHKYATKHPYGQWLTRYSLQLNDYTLMMTDEELRRELYLSLEGASCTNPVSLPHCEVMSECKRHYSEIAYGKELETVSTEHVDVDITLQLIMFGYTSEKVDLILSPMAKYASEPLGSMGNDTPSAILSSLPKTFTEYFSQNFAQGTNPPFDAIREGNVISLACPIGQQGDLFSVVPHHAKRVFLDEPILSPAQFRVLLTLPGYPTEFIDLSWPKSQGFPDLVTVIKGIQKKAEKAVRAGNRLLILSDRRAGPDRYFVWTSIAVGAVHLHLLHQRLRTNCGLIVETGEACEVHQLAFHLSSGADALYPYLAYRALSKTRFLPDEFPLPLERLIENYISALRLALFRVLAKIGICTMLSYKGGCFFQSLGIQTSVLRLCFDDRASAKVGGIGFPILADDLLRLHTIAYPLRPLPGLVDGVPSRQLPDVGDYRFVSIQDSESHMNHPDTIKYLRAAVSKNDYSTYRQYSDIQNALVDDIELRGQLEFVLLKQRPVPLKEVELVTSIVKRLVCGAVSFGSVSEEAWTTLARAMDSIGSRNNTGEGGELEEVSEPMPRNRTKQIASGRFGVTSFFLSDCDELQIKCGNGGSELPGYKVIGKVAAIRRSTPGVCLISPPPHHDIYSIEDVAQLIMDLRHANPKARISVKLVTKFGVGVIAAGCVKAKCDHILISGSLSSAGSTKLGSIRHSGLPWELGLAETHQTLCLNGLRDKVVLQVDGQLKTGRDVVYAALLGAEEFGFVTQPLIAMGCQMMRKCHLNTCPSGIATQDPELRKRFRGKPEHVVNYFFMVAEEIRTYMARLGFRQFQQMIGRSDLLRPKVSLSEHWKRNTLDFRQLLMPGWMLSSPLDKFRHSGIKPIPRPMYCCSTLVHEFDQVLDREIIRRAKRALENQISTNVLHFPIRNVDRSVGGLLSYEVSTRYGREGLPANTIRVNFRGSAGQSFGCWLASGITFRLSGDCNDCVGKGLSGGVIAVKPPAESTFWAESDKNIIVGNAALYGATSGRAFFAGVAAERFAVRNSGAVAVAEGCGDYGCEYMTRGIVVILGDTGRGFAAGMTGGIAYVLDLNIQHVNTQTIDLEPVVGTSVGRGNSRPLGSSTEFGSSNTDSQDTATKRNKDAKVLENLLVEHFQLTKSAVAERILENLPQYLPRFTKVFPKDMKRVLKQAIQDYVTNASLEAVAILDDWDMMTSAKHEHFHLQSLPYTMSKYTADFENRQRQFKRLRLIDVSESALKVVEQYPEGSALGQYAADLERSGRLDDLLSEEGSEHLAELMRMTRFVYAQWRTGNGRDLRKNVTDSLMRLLPETLTASRRSVLKKFLLEEKRQLEDHLQALEGCKLAEDLFRQMRPAKPQTASSSCHLTQMTRPEEWEEIFGDQSPEANATVSAITPDLESLALESSPEKSPKILSHFRRRRDQTSVSLEQRIDSIAIEQPQPTHKPFLVRSPDALKGFVLYDKQKTPLKSARTRVLDWEEISVSIDARSRLYDSLQKTQAARCIICGTPTCSYPNAEGGGCPLGNRIPTWNTLVVEGQWRFALERLLDTNNFPEFTGRVCPAPCEKACVLAENDQSVAIKSIELAIIERGFQSGWIRPAPPKFRSRFSIAIVGSGPSGLAAAQMLNRAGHHVTVYEKADRFGGLLMYGIPNMKLDKKKVVQRRLDLLAAEGIRFRSSTCIGKDVLLTNLLEDFTVVLLAVGTQRQGDLALAGRHLDGIVQGLEFLTRSQKSLLDSDFMDDKAIDAVGMNVVVIGSGSTATDCIATAVRMGCNEVIQFIERIRDASSDESDPVFKVEYGHEEALAMQGSEPREFGVRAIEFIPSQNNGKTVGGVKAVRVHSKSSSLTKKSDGVDLIGTERVYAADLVVIALNTGAVDETLSGQIPLTDKGLIAASSNSYSTGIKGLFACGDCRMGMSLVVNAIAEGRAAAQVIDNYLVTLEEQHLPKRSFNKPHVTTKVSQLPSTCPTFTNPLRAQ